MFEWNTKVRETSQLFRWYQCSVLRWKRSLVSKVGEDKWKSLLPRMTGTWMCLRCRPPALVRWGRMDSRAKQPLIAICKPRDQKHLHQRQPPSDYCSGWMHVSCNFKSLNPKQHLRPGWIHGSSAQAWLPKALLYVGVVEERFKSVTEQEAATWVPGRWTYTGVTAAVNRLFFPIATLRVRLAYQVRLLS